MKKIIIIILIWFWIFSLITFLYSWKITNYYINKNFESIMSTLGFLDENPSIKLFSKSYISTDKSIICSNELDCTNFIKENNVNNSELNYTKCWNYYKIYKDCHPDLYCNFILFNTNWFKDKYPNGTTSVINDNFILHDNPNWEMSDENFCRLEY